MQQKKTPNEKTNPSEESKPERKINISLSFSDYNFLVEAIIHEELNCENFIRDLRDSAHYYSSEFLHNIYVEQKRNIETAIRLREELFFASLRPDIINSVHREAQDDELVFQYFFKPGKLDSIVKVLESNDIDIDIYSPDYGLYDLISQFICLLSKGDSNTIHFIRDNIFDDFPF